MADCREIESHIDLFDRVAADIKLKGATEVFKCSTLDNLKVIWNRHRLYLPELEERGYRLKDNRTKDNYKLYRIKRFFNAQLKILELRPNAD